VTALLGALRAHRDRTMFYAMVLGGLRPCDVLGLRLGDIQLPERSVFLAEGKGGHQRVIPISNTFFTPVGDYLHHERPRGCETDRVFVTLRGTNRGRPMTADGSTRSSRPPASGLAWNGRCAISCAKPA
jgi:integrase/recombinase XerD